MIIETLGLRLQANRFYKFAELVVFFGIPLGFIFLSKPLVGDHLILKQASVWIANIIMLLLVWFGLKLRGESWKDFGLFINAVGWKQTGRTFLISLLVFILALAGFVLGSIIMANITGIPESSDMSGYNYLKDNLGMLILTLAGVYIVSSFGEEVIYRAFLIKRIAEIGHNTKRATIIAVILSSVVFGLVHFEWGPMGIVQTAFMGLALSICYLKLNKWLWPLVLAHAYMDTILMAQLYLA